MSRQYYSTGSPLEEFASYSRAVADGEWVFVSGTTGFDYANMTISDDVVEQTEQTFSTIKDALSEFGASFEDVIRVRVFIVDINDWEAINRIVGKYFKDIRPANTTVASPLVDPRMKVEIEVTALKRKQ
jgi:reactive intermediate/imine deaminase